MAMAVVKFLNKLIIYDLQYVNRTKNDFNDHLQQQKCGDESRYTYLHDIYKWYCYRSKQRIFGKIIFFPSLPNSSLPPSLCSFIYQTTHWPSQFAVFLQLPLPLYYYHSRGLTLMFHYRYICWQPLENLFPTIGTDAYVIKTLILKFGNSQVNWVWKYTPFRKRCQSFFA